MPISESGLLQFNDSEFKDIAALMARFNAMKVASASGDILVAKTEAHTWLVSDAHTTCKEYVLEAGNGAFLVRRAPDAPVVADESGSAARFDMMAAQMNQLRSESMSMDENVTLYINDNDQHVGCYVFAAPLEAGQVTFGGKRFTDLPQLVEFLKSNALNGKTDKPVLMTHSAIKDE